MCHAVTVIPATAENVVVKFETFMFYSYAKRQLTTYTCEEVTVFSWDLLLTLALSKTFAL